MRRIQIPDFRLPVWILDSTPHRSRSRRRSFGSSVCSSMYVSEHPAHLVSNLGTPGRLSHSSVVFLSRPTFTPDGVRCGRDELTPARHGFNNAMQRRPGTAAGRKVSSPPQCMIRSSALPLSSYCQVRQQCLRRPRQFVKWKNIVHANSHIRPVGVCSL